MSKNNEQRVYSYARFSSKEQGEGDSERRQIEAAEEFAKSKGMVLDDTLRMIDRGLSGYKGTNLKKGALGIFLEKVKSGEVAEGSVLVVENIDRLTRAAPSDAFETIVTGLLKQGIIIEMLSPRFTFTRDSVDSGGIWPLMAYMVMAYDESKKKAGRIEAFWEGKRRIASKDQMLTSRAPAWLDIKTTYGPNPSQRASPARRSGCR